MIVDTTSSIFAREFNLPLWLCDNNDIFGMLGSPLSSGFNENTVTPIEVLVPSRIQPFGEPTFVLD
jgi:hypothetical protein